MAVLTTKKRNQLPSSTFALPEQRKYPLDTPGRARNALSRGAQNASHEQLATIKAKVRRKYPGIKVGGEGEPSKPRADRSSRRK